MAYATGQSPSYTRKRKKNNQLGTEGQSSWMADNRRSTERDRQAPPGRASGGAMHPPQPQQPVALQRAEIASPKQPFYAHVNNGRLAESIT